VVAFGGEQWLVADLDRAAPEPVFMPVVLRAVQVVLRSPDRPSSEVLAYAQDGMVYRVRVHDQPEVVGELAGGPAQVRWLTALRSAVVGVEPDGADSGRSMLRTWDAATGRLASRFRLHGDVHALAAEGDDLVVWHGRELTRLTWTPADTRWNPTHREVEDR
jgi:hypothetical protein